MGTNCVPFLANLFLHSYEVEFLRSIKKSNEKLAKAFNLTSLHIDDLMIINKPRFKQFLKDICTEEFVASETSESRNVVSYLDFLIDISNGDLVCSIFDKRDAFDFDTVNFPDLSGNPTAPTDGTYISQLIRYRWVCHNYDNFSSRHSMLAERLFNQDFSAREMMRTFCKFMGRYSELASKVQQESIINDM